MLVAGLVWLCLAGLEHGSKAPAMNADALTQITVATSLPEFPADLPLDADANHRTIPSAPTGPAHSAGAATTTAPDVVSGPSGETAPVRPMDKPPELAVQSEGANGPDENHEALAATDPVDTSAPSPAATLTDRSTAPFPPEASPGPRIAIILTGFGLDPVLARAAAELPKAVAMGWSVYADDPLAGQAEMRLIGRETWLELPISHGESSRFDVGPLGLSPSRTDERNLELLKMALAKGSDVAGTLAEPGAFATSPARFVPIAAMLSERTLALLLHGDFSRTLADEPGLAAVAADGSLPVTTLPVSVDQFLEQLSVRAKREGSAIGVMRAHPLTIARLLRWQEGIQSQGLTLVPPSMLLHAAPDPVVAATGGSPGGQGRAGKHGG
jgi:polysaccharide deacetylase 2 family uncharacterized protein YibQ